MKKVIIVLLFLCVAGAGGFGTWHFRTQSLTAQAEKQSMVSQNMQLQSKLDAIGTITNVCTVVDTVECGDVITTEDLTVMSIPESAVVNNTITDPSQIVGLYWKVDVNPGTPITADLVMGNELSATAYELDMVFDYLPLGLSVGDYVNVLITLPYGETYCVMTHKRVEQLLTSKSTIKVYVDSAEHTLWISAKKDAALYGNKGMSLSVVKYVEPGVQDAAIPFYPVRAEVANAVKDNPNITDQNSVINSVLRAKIDRYLTAVDDVNGELFASDKSKDIQEMLGAIETYENEKSTNPEFQTSAPVVNGGTGSSGSNVNVLDINSAAAKLEEELNNLNTVLGEETIE